jgi:outer membrane protein assembly factor BamD (BamD/ComL family)
VFNFYKIMRAFAAVGAWSVLMAGMAYAQCDASHYKEGEYEMYSQAAKDVTANAFDKAIGELNAWQQKYPESACRNQRTTLLIQAYNGGKQPSKVLAVTSDLFSKGVPEGLPAADVIRALYLATSSITNMPNPTPEDVANGEKAARALLAYDKKPDGVEDAAWAQTKSALQAAAKGALLTIAVRPGIAALAKNPQDCETAESSLSKALSDYPDNAYVAYNLGQAYRCQAKKDQAKYDEIYPRAVYEFIRAMVIDPSLGGTQDGKKMTDVLTNLYVNYHGGNDGLEELKQQAKANPLPPAGFAIESATKVAERKQKEFEAKYPQLAMWLGIKGQLASPNGMQFFNDQMKGADVPKLKGMLVEGKPACRSKELLVSVPEPNQQGTAAAVITLKLDAPVAGKPEAGEIQWKGVPSAFNADPFMLTMDTEKAQIEELKTTPCAPAAARPGVKKGGGTKKK